MQSFFLIIFAQNKTFLRQVNQLKKKEIFFFLGISRILLTCISKLIRHYKPLKYSSAIQSKHPGLLKAVPGRFPFDCFMSMSLNDKA